MEDTMNKTSDKKFVNQGKIAYQIFIKQANQLHENKEIIELKRLTRALRFELKSLLKLINNSLEFNKIYFLYSRILQFEKFLSSSNYKKAFAIINDYKKNFSKGE